MASSKISTIPTIKDLGQRVEFAFYSTCIGVTYADNGIVERIEPTCNVNIAFPKTSHAKTSLPKSSKTSHRSLLSDEMCALADELQEKQLQDTGHCAATAVAAPLTAQSASSSAPVAAAAVISHTTLSPRVYSVIYYRNKFSR